MENLLYQNIIKKASKEKIFTLLIDPNKYTNESLKSTVLMASESGVDYIFVGGSLISHLQDIEHAISIIKKYSTIPVILFPGSLLQITNSADGILLLSLISGRNPDFLIGNHVIAAPVLKNTRLEIIPTGYILIENGKTTSVEYISNTRPIPSDKTEIIVATSIAGEMTGNKLIYLEAGSGAKHPVSARIIREVKKNINIPLIVGGGIKNIDQMIEAYEAGADMLVVGNAIENSGHLLSEMAKTSRKRMLL